MPRQLADNLSFDDCHDHLAYTAAALTAAGQDGDKEVHSLLSRADKMLNDWAALDAERRAQSFATVTANAVVRRRDHQADAVMTDVHNDVLGHVKQNRQAPLFTRFFPDPLSSIVPLGLESELPYVREIKVHLADSDTPAAIRKSHDKPIAEVVTRGEAAIEQRNEANRGQAKLSAKVAAWRDRANQALLGIEGALTSIAAERNLGRDWVDTYFTPPQPKKKKKDAAAKTTPAPAQKTEAAPQKSEPATPAAAAPTEANDGAEKPATATG